jgi:hypothetical protein
VPEKFFDIKCRKAGLTPAAAVVVATCRALKMHGGVAKEDLGRGEDLGALARGLANLDRHVANVAKFGVPATVGINRFAADTEAELDLVLAHCRDALGLEAFVCDHWAAGSAGIEGLARHVASLCEEGRPSRFAYLYPDEMPLWEKARTIAREIYGAEDISRGPEGPRPVRRLPGPRLRPLPGLRRQDPVQLLDRPDPAGRPVRPRRARARAAPERRRGVRGRGLRRHHDHAGPAEGPGGARDPARRERAGGGACSEPARGKVEPRPGPAAKQPASSCWRRSGAGQMGGGRRILVVDVGGKNIKCWCSTTPERRKAPSGPGLTPEVMVAAALELSAGWGYDVVSLGLPGPVRDGRVTLDPVNLGPGWVGFDLAAAFGCPPGSSTTPRCRRWGPTRAAACCSSASAPGSAPR